MIPIAEMGGLIYNSIEKTSIATGGYTFSNLAIGTDYTIFVKAWNDRGFSIKSIKTNTRGIVPVLNNLITTNPLADSITLNQPTFSQAGNPIPTVRAWIGNPDIQYNAATDSITGSLKEGPVDVSSGSHTFSNLASNSDYMIIVVAKNSDGISEKDILISTSPSAPVLNDLMIGNVDGSSIILRQPTFSKTGNPAPTIMAYIGISGQIQYDADSIDITGTIKEGPINVSAGDYQFVTLEANSLYRIIVIAKNDEGTSVKEITQSTSGIKPVLNDLITNDPEATSITLKQPTFSTQGNPLPVVTAYLGFTDEISHSGSTVSNALFTSDVSNGDYIFDNLNPYTEYTIIVVASNKEGDSVELINLSTRGIAPVLNDLATTNPGSSEITLVKPTFAVAGNPSPSVLAYIDYKTTLQVNGNIVSGSADLIGPIDATTGDLVFRNLKPLNDYTIVVIASNNEGYYTKQIDASTMGIAPVLDNLRIQSTETTSITLDRPGFTTTGNPVPAVTAYIGVDGEIRVTGSTVNGTIKETSDVSTGGYQFQTLEVNTDYRIIVVASNNQGFSVKEIVQSTKGITPVLNDLVIDAFDHNSITLEQPSFSVQGNPDPVVQAYIGISGQITLNGSAVGGTIIEGPVNVATAGYQFQNLSALTNYLIIVVSSNNEGYTTKFIEQQTAATPAPRINVTSGGNSVSSYNFGSIYNGDTSEAHTFTIENTGTGNLNLTGNPLVAISGSGASQFTVTQPGVSTIASNANTTFTVQFRPTTTGSSSATISIYSNDRTYSFTVTGTGTTRPLPEIDIRIGSTSYATAGRYTFATTAAGQWSEIRFTIYNTGAADLVLSGTEAIVLSGTDANQFRVNPPSGTTITAGNSATFDAFFMPTSRGTKNAQISITNNDSDENPYVINLRGTGTAPSINVRMGTQTIPDDTGSYTYAGTNTGSTAIANFSVYNSGDAPLSLYGTPYVALSGTDANQFSVSQPASGTVNANSSQAFSITFRPTTPGSKTATVTITSNDTSNPSYTFTVTGNAILGPPTGLAVTQPSASVQSLNVTWNTYSGSRDSFELQRQSGSGEFITVLTAAADQYSYTDSAVQAGCRYTYRIRAVYQSSSSAWSSTAERAVVYNTAPSGLAATAVSGNVVNLSWNDTSYEYGMVTVEYYSAAMGGYRTCTSVNISENSCQITGLNACEEYHFRIRYSSTYTNSGYSNETSTETLPNTPTELQLQDNTTNTSYVTNLSWRHSTNPQYSYSAGSIRYIVERKAGAAGTYSELGRVDCYDGVGGNYAYSYTDSAAKQGGVEYYYRISAGWGGVSSAYCESQAMVFLTAPTDLAVTSTATGSIGISWQPVTGATSYHLYYGTYSNFPNGTELTPSGGQTGNSFTHTQLTGNTNYYYKVIASTASKRSIQSAELTALTRPAAHTSFTVRAISSTEITVFVSEMTNGLRYILYRGVSDSEPFTEAGNFVASTPTLTINQTGMDMDTDYYYRMSVTNASGEGDQSTSKIASTIAPPTDVQVTDRQNHSLTVTWQGGVNAEVYHIERSVNNGPFEDLAMVNSPATEYADTGLDTCTMYTYRIYGTNSNLDNGNYSATATEYTVFAEYIISNITFGPGPSPTYMEVSWDHVTNIDEYMIYTRPKGVGEFTTDGRTITGTAARVSTSMEKPALLGDYEMMITGVTVDPECGTIVEFTIDDI